MKMRKSGGYITGKQLVEGNSPKNDTVPILASPGELVIDKETIDGGPMSILKFAMRELSDHHPDYKDHYDIGGVVSNIADAAKKYVLNHILTTNVSEEINKMNADPVNHLNDSYRPGYDSGGTVGSNFGGVSDAVKKTNPQAGSFLSSKPTSLDNAVEHPINTIANWIQGKASGGMVDGHPSYCASCGGMIQKFYSGGTVKPQGYEDGGTVFDPDKYLSEKTSASAPAFDPDQYLSQKGIDLDESKPFKFSGPGAGAMRQDVLSKEEMAPVATNLKYPAAIVGGAIGGIPGAAAMGALGEAIGQGYKATALNQDVSPKEAAKEIGKAGLEMGAQELGGKIIGKGLDVAMPYISKAAGNVAAKAGETLTGIPKQVIQTYAKHADEINEMAHAADGSIAQAADEMRKGFSDSIQATKGKLNSQISSTLAKSDKTVPIQSSIASLEDIKSQLNPDIHSQDIAQIDKIIDKIKGREIKEMVPTGNQLEPVMTGTGQMPVKDAHELKQYMQGIVSDSYRKPGEIFTSGSGADRAIKSAASNMRQEINVAEPKIAEANNSLSELHNIDDSMNSNLISAGKPEAALISAGSGSNPRNVQSLERLGEMTGTDMKGQAEKLAAMRTFNEPGWTPVDSTGKSAARIGLGGGAGALIGHMTGIPGAEMTGAAIGTGATSPAALKAAINLGRKIPNAPNMEAIAPVVVKTVGAMMSDKKDPYSNMYNSGLNNLINHADRPEDKKMIESMREKLSNDPKGQQLLLEASSLKPGSKRMGGVLQRVKGMQQ